MELLCVERLAEPRFATGDATIFQDMRTFRNLLDQETLHVPPCDYFRSVQSEIRPFMRKVVATWMLEVCEEQRCEDPVFPLAINLMDRFLCSCYVPKDKLQLLAATALLVASKIRQSVPLSIQLLCYYTENAFLPENLQAWELLLVTKLKWQLSAVTGMDCVHHALQRLPWTGESPLLRTHAQTLLALCYTEPQFVRTRPSLLAAACLGSAARGLRLPCAAAAMGDACELLGADPTAAEAACAQLERLLDSHAAASAAGPAPTPRGAASAAAGGKSAAAVPAADKPETPTDVQSVLF